jgi:N-acyl-D-amino-acid deacylase
MTLRTRGLFLAVALLCGTPACVGPQDKPSSIVIVNATLADGTGQPLRAANVRIAAGRIVEIGQVEPRTGEQTLDAAGLVLAPGFIDIHNHSTEGLESDPLAETQIAQASRLSFLV